jgi:hypothetical protein
VRDVDSSVAAVRRIGGRGTPTVLVNGWFLRYIPDAIALKRRVVAAIEQAGRVRDGHK